MSAYRGQVRAWLGVHKQGAPAINITPETSATHEVDWLVIGSGFGGSTSALRLVEKGHRVRVLECGRRFADDEFAERTSQMSSYYWMPKLGLKGIMRMSLFRDVFVVSGCGVGGGSLGYANTLYRARPGFYDSPQIRALADWESELAPHYETAERMLGAATFTEESAADTLLREYAEENGFGHTYTDTRVGVYLDNPGVTVPDPFFGGEGPDRTGCLRCGSCMVGCRFGAKNTLVKNYLYLAERRGAQVDAERTVTDIRPLGAADGSDGYEVTHERTGSWLRRDRQTVTAKGVVVAAGALGTNRLLFRCKLSGSLPNVSERLGHLVRTNSESILAVTAPDDNRDFTRAVAITSSIHPSPDTHIEPVTYGTGGDSQSLLFTLMTEAGGRGTQPLALAANIARHPIRFLRASRTRAWSRRTVVLLVMQTLPGAMRLKADRRWPNGNPILTTEQDPDNPNPDKIPAAYRAAEWMASRVNGTPQAMVTEAALSIPTTAHILGGAVVGADAATGVVDSAHRVFGYRRLMVCDGSAVPANVGANPSLTITAMTERAMATVADGDGPKLDPVTLTATRPLVTDTTAPEERASNA